jgi:hypothetical protein
MHILVHKDSRAAAAHLTTITEHGRGHFTCSLADIRVVKDNRGTFAAKLQSHSLQVTFGSRLLYSSASHGGARECNLIQRCIFEKYLYLKSIFKYFFFGEFFTLDFAL